MVRVLRLVRSRQYGVRRCIGFWMYWLLDGDRPSCHGLYGGIAIHYCVYTFLARIYSIKIILRTSAEFDEFRVDIIFASCVVGTCSILRG